MTTTVKLRDGSHVYEETLRATRTFLHSMSKAELSALVERALHGDATQSVPTAFLDKREKLNDSVKRIILNSVEREGTATHLVSPLYSRKISRLEAWTALASIAQKDPSALFEPWKKAQDESYIMPDIPFCQEIIDAFRSLLDSDGNMPPDVKSVVLTACKVDNASIDLDLQSVNPATLLAE